jgi:hypothetical protein
MFCTHCLSAHGAFVDGLFLTKLTTHRLGALLLLSDFEFMAIYVVAIAVSVHFPYFVVVDGW